jgi:hypothetical protein
MAGPGETLGSPWPPPAMRLWKRGNATTKLRGLSQDLLHAMPYERPPSAEHGGRMGDGYPKGGT